MKAALVDPAGGSGLSLGVSWSPKGHDLPFVQGLHWELERPVSFAPFPLTLDFPVHQINHLDTMALLSRTCHLLS